MQKKIVRLYMEIFDKITKNNEIENYRDIKEEIKNKCSLNKNYKSKVYVNLELERINLKLQEENSQYISIIYTIIIFVLPILATVILKLININLEKANTELWSTLFMYLFTASIYFATKIIDKIRKYKCYYIYKNVLEEFKINNVEMDIKEIAMDIKEPKE